MYACIHRSCTPAFGTWCQSHSPHPPAPSPGPPSIPLPPALPDSLQRLTINYAISLANFAGKNSVLKGSTHVILSFIEPSTGEIPPSGRSMSSILIHIHKELH